MSGLRPKLLSYHRNQFRLAPTARLQVDQRIHLSTSPTTWGSSYYIEMKGNSRLHFTGKATFRGEGRIFVDENAKLTFGNHCVFRERLWISAHQEIIIGDGSGTGQDCMIIDSDVHPIICDGKELPRTAPVHIGNHVWIGAHCIILKGVHIGDETVIGAGSLVTQDIPDHVIAVGRPARLIRRIDRHECLNYPPRNSTHQADFFRQEIPNRQIQEDFSSQADPGLRA